MKVSAIVLSWNSREYITPCIKSLEKVAHPGVDFEIIIVDNGSTDGSPDFLKEKFSRHTLIINDSNLGYAEGNNTGIRKALDGNSDFVWIVNPDVYVDKDALMELYTAALKYRDTGIFGSKIYFAPGFEFHKDRYKPEQIGKVIWYAGGRIDWANLIASHRGVDEVDEHQYDRDLETDFVTGASMFIRAQVLQDIGVLDWRYFLYYEENDFCQRALRHGYRLMYIWKSVVWHANAQATGIGSGLQDYYISRNRLLFGLRYASAFTKYALVRESLRLYLRGRPWQRRGVIDYWKRNFGTGSYQP